MPGVSSFAQFNNIAQQALGDSLKMTLVKMGGADLLFTGAGLVADFKAGPQSANINICWFP
jgi:hypothetical protein